MSGSDSTKNFGEDINKFRPDDNLDAALRQELDEALGGMSISDLLEKEEAQKRTDLPKGVRRGTVCAIGKSELFVDMGSKSQGILSMLQFEDQELPKVGDTIDVTIEGYDNAEGLLILSRQGAVMQAAWQTLTEGQMLEGRVTGFNKGGLEITLNGIPAFMPISQIELYRLEDLSPYVNTKMQCQVIEVNPEERKVVVSRRALLELEQEKAREQMWETLTEGKTVKGTVRNIMPYGAFVSLGNGVDGLLHVSDMSHSRVADPNTVVKEGQPLELMVLKVDKDTRRISLGLKQILPDPWADAEKKWPINEVISGRVTRLADFGAFVELESGAEGLVPMSEMSFEKRINKASEVLTEGQVVRVRVMSLDVAKKRISLSIKRVGDDPWVGASVRFAQGSVIKGLVKRLTDFGAFIELVPGVEGLAHISELSNERVKTVSDAVQEGQTVNVKILEVEEDRRRISLSVKQAIENAYAGGDYSTTAASSKPMIPGAQPAPAAQGAHPAEPEKPAKKRKKPLKGGLE
jgi:small subunit ribosomal protein S1